MQRDKKDKKYTVEVDEPKPVNVRRPWFSIWNTIKFITNAAVCVAIMLIVGAFTRSSFLSVSIAFLYTQYYPGFIIQLGTSLFKGGFKEAFFNQNHLWNILACVFFLIIYVFSNIFMNLLIVKVEEREQFIK